MTMGMERDPQRPSEETPTLKTIRHSPAELSDLITSEEDMLAGEQDSFAYKLALESLKRRWTISFGMEYIPLSYPDTVSTYAYEGTNPDKVAQLLGPKGPAMLGKISGLINVAAVEGKWPLEALEVHRQIDPEFDPKNILVVLRLRTSFEQADEILKSLYPKIQNLTDSLSGDERSVLTSGIFFDIEPVVPPEPQE